MSVHQSPIGVTRNQASQEEKQSDALVIPINKPGTYTLHPIGGLKRYVRRWVPVLRYNPTTMTMEPSFTCITGDSVVLDSIEKADQGSRKKYFQLVGERDGHPLDEKDLNRRSRSRLAPSTHYAILAFDDSDNPPVVKKVLMPWSAWEALKKLQEKLSAKRPGNLMFGPMYTFRCIIEHSRDDSRGGPEEFRHSYNVSAYDAPFRDQLPATLLDEAPSLELVGKCFSPEELEALEANQIDLTAETAPMTDDQIREVFVKTPINLGALEGENQFPVFVDTRVVVQELEKAQIAYQLPSGAPSGAPALNAPPASAPKVPTVARGRTAPKTPEPLPEIEEAQLSESTETTGVPFDQDQQALNDTSADLLGADTADRGGETNLNTGTDSELPTAESLGWASDEDLTKVLDNFEPQNMVAKITFAKWKEQDCSREGFEKYFPGELAKLIGAKPAAPVTRPIPLKPVVEAPVATAKPATTPRTAAATTPAKPTETAQGKPAAAKKSGRRW